jgi:C-terminal processing protease CtpA/Prc
MAIVGSTSAGDPTRTTQFQLPGGLRIRFGQTDMVRHDGTRLSGAGVAPTVAVEPSWPAVRERDELLERARILLG